MSRGHVMNAGMCDGQQDAHTPGHPPSAASMLRPWLHRPLLAPYAVQLACRAGTEQQMSKAGH